MSIEDRRLSYEEQWDKLDELQLGFVEKLKERGVLKKVQVDLAKDFLDVKHTDEGEYFANTSPEEFAERITNPANYFVRREGDDPIVDDDEEEVKVGVEYYDGIHTMTAWIGHITYRDGGAKIESANEDTYMLSDAQLVLGCTLELKKYKSKGTLPDLGHDFTYIYESKK